MAKNNSTLKVSKRFVSELKLHDLPAYRIAQKAGIDPNMLSKLINGIDQVRKDDYRILAVGKILRLRAKECFEQ